MAKYAAQTSVSVERSRAEIEATLARYGATHFGYLSEPGKAIIGFACRDRKIRFIVKLPDITAREFTHTPKQHSRRSGEAQHEAWEQACRQKWRALLLAIKAKLEAVDAEIATFEEEFLAYVVDPATGTTVYESIREGIQQHYIGNNSVPLLPGPTA